MHVMVLVSRELAGEDGVVTGEGGGVLHALSFEYPVTGFAAKVLCRIRDPPDLRRVDDVCTLALLAAPSECLGKCMLRSGAAMQLQVMLLDACKACIAHPVQCPRG